MFYSHDLLGRKSPLGAIWTMAHGKKLSKCKILGINVSDVCNQIMQPDVPHSLRLQGILIGGIVVVYNKQQIYLLEDLQDMMRKVKAAAVPEAAAAAAVNTLLQKGRDKARLESITLMDVDDFMVTSLDLPLPPPMTLALTASNTHDGNDVADGQDELFVVPTLALTQADIAAAASGGARAPSDPYAAGHFMDQQDEMFEAPDLQQLLMDGDADDAFIQALAAGEDAKKQAKKRQPRKQHDEAAAAAADDAGLLMEVPDELLLMGAEDAAQDMMMMDMVPDPMADAMPPPSPPPYDMQEPAAAGGGKPADKKRPRFALEDGESDVTVVSDQQLDPEAHPDDAVNGGAAEQQTNIKASRRVKAAAEGRKRRKGAQVTMDDLEDIQVSNRIYREWTLDHADLMAPRFKGKAAAAAGAARLSASLQRQANQGLDEQLLAALAAGNADKAVAAALRGPATTIRGMPWSAALLATVNSARHASAVDVAEEDEELAGARPKRQRTAKNAAAAAAGALQLAERTELEMVPTDAAAAAAAAGAAGLHADDMDDMFLPPMEDMMMMHDMDELPYEVETERLRKATTPSGSDMQRAGLGSPGSANLLLANGMLTTGGRSKATTASGSSLGRESEQGLGARAGGVRSRQAAAANGNDSVGNSPRGQQPLLRFGNGALEDLLPAIEETGAEMMFDMGEEPTLDLDGRAAGGAAGFVASGTAGTSSRRPGSTAGTSSGKAFASLTQFNLVETNNGTQLPPNACVSKSTMTVIAIYRQRLGLLASQAAADPTVSFFDLAGQLQRKEAVKLFYQTLVTHSTGFVVASQDVPYGDVTIRPGRFI